MTNEMVRIANDPEGREELSKRVGALMDEVAADYGGTPADVARVVTYLLKQVEKKGYKTAIKVPEGKVEEEILSAIAARFEATDVLRRRGTKVVDSRGIVTSFKGKEDIAKQAQDAREGLN